MIYLRIVESLKPGPARKCLLFGGWFSLGIWFLVLGLLWEQDNQTIKSLGQKLHLDSGTLTPLVKRLEKAKYLCRRRDKTDERSNTISLTKQGLALKKEGVVAAEKFYQSLALKEREQEQLKKLLDNWLIQQGFMEKT